MKPLPTVQSSESSWAFEGGMDLATPQLQKKPGVAIEATNFDIPASGGYRRMWGYERFDGRPRPSDAAVLILGGSPTFDASLQVGDAIEGDTSGATAVIAHIPEDRSFIAVTKVSGTFAEGEDILDNTSAVVGTYAGFAQPLSAGVQNELAAAAADLYRADIEAPEGSGPIRGVFAYKDDVYAWRDNEPGTACVLHRATASGWVAVPFGVEVYFENGTGLAEGDTLTQGGVTATIKRVILTEGSVPYKGKLIVTDVTGGSLAAGPATTTGGSLTILSAAQITHAPGGRFDIDIYNFTGDPEKRRVYGASGVDRAFEFDGENLVPIDTGMVDDKPMFVRGHRNYLFLLFKGGSVQFSSIPGSGLTIPFVWNVVTGAGEIALGDEPTGMDRGPGSEQTSTLIIWTRQATFAIYGDGSGSNAFRKDTVSPQTGALPHTQSTVIEPVYLDDLGITTLSASDRFGNFAANSISDQIRAYIAPRIESAVGSVVVRKENQYRLFFDDGTGITVTFRGRRPVGVMPFQTQHVFTCFWESEDKGGIILAGGSNGMVYELERGRSFDGQPINARLRLAYNYCRSPMLRKKFNRLVLYIAAQGRGSFDVTWLASDNDERVQASALSAEFVGGGSGFDDPSVGFDAGFGLDSDEYVRVGKKIGVTGTSLSLIFQQISANQLPFTLTSATLLYVPRRNERR